MPSAQFEQHRNTLLGSVPKTCVVVCFNLFGIQKTSIQYNKNRIELNFDRTTRRYRRTSHSFKEAMLHETKHMSGTLSKTLQGQSTFSEFKGPKDKKEAALRNNALGKHAGRYAIQERYSYLQVGATHFQDISILSIVADAVHVGSEDWLNIFAYSPEKDMAIICPQQA